MTEPPDRPPADEMIFSYFEEYDERIKLMVLEKVMEAKGYSEERVNATYDLAFENHKKHYVDELGYDRPRHLEKIDRLMWEHYFPTEAFPGGLTDKPIVNESHPVIIQPPPDLPRNDTQQQAAVKAVDTSSSALSTTSTSHIPESKHFGGLAPLSASRFTLPAPAPAALSSSSAGQGNMSNPSPNTQVLLDNMRLAASLIRQQAGTTRIGSDKKQ